MKINKNVFFIIVLIFCFLISCKTSIEINDYKIELYDVETQINKNNQITIDEVNDYTLLEEKMDSQKLMIVKYIEENNMLDNIYDFQVSYNAKLKRSFQNLIDYIKEENQDIFSEELLVAYLQKNMYKIEKNGTNTVIKELGLKYDYSNYIERKLNFDIYFSMLKELYILENFNGLIDDSNIRLISVYSSTDLYEIQIVVDKLFSNEYTNINDIEKYIREDEIKELGRQYCLNLGYENQYYEGTCYASTSSSTYDSALSKFTTCNNGLRCTILEGLEYHINLITSKNYVEKYIVSDKYLNIKSNNVTIDKVISYDSSNIRVVGNSNESYFVNPIYKNDLIQSNYDLIFFDNEPISTRKYYLINVKNIKTEGINEGLIDSSNVELILNELIDKINDDIVLDCYFKDIDFDISELISNSSSESYDVGKMTVLSKEQLKTKLVSSDTFTLITGSKSCSHCKQLNSIIDKYINEDRIVYYVDMSVIYELMNSELIFSNIPDDRNININVLYTPTTFYIENGIFKDALVGVFGINGGIEYYQLCQFMEGKFVNDTIDNIINE